MANTIHNSAYISTKAKIGDNNTIGAFVIIEDDVVIGDNNVIAARTSIKNGSRISCHNIFHEGVILGGEPQDISFKAQETLSIIGNNNVLREYVIIHRASSSDRQTRIGDHNYLMNGVHLGHDCELTDKIIMAPYAALAGHVSVENNVFISGGVMVHQFSNIGCYAMLGGNSKITQSVLPYMITDGVPGVVKGINRVALKRANFSANSIKLLKQAFNILFQKGLHSGMKANSLTEILTELAKLDSVEVKHLVHFIKSQKRGFHRTTRK